MKIYTSLEVAKILGCSVRNVQRLAKSRKLGIKLNARTIVFSGKEIDNMANRKNGRPSLIPLCDQVKIMEDLEIAGKISDISEARIVVRPHKNDTVICKVKNPDSDHTLYVVR